MGSATRESRAVVEQAVATLGAKATHAVGVEVLDAARVLASSAQLRAVLADAAADKDAKAKLVGTVFAGLSATARAIVDVHVAARWSSDDDLVDGLEESGIRVAAKKHEGRILEDLFAFETVVASEPDLELALSAKLGDPAAKATLVRELLAGKAADQTVDIVAHLVASPRGRRFRHLIAAAADAVAEQAEVKVATVTVAKPLAAKQAKALETSLAAQYGTGLKLHEVVDPSVLGGVRVQVGTDVIDGTISSRINDLRLQLA